MDDLRTSFGAASFGCSAFAAAASPVIGVESAACSWFVALVLLVGALLLPPLMED